MQILAILATASLTFAKVLPFTLKEQGCIFEATRSADLKSSFYRKNCRKNLEKNEYDHWLLEEEDRHLIWREYNGDEGMRQVILKSDCDHILESQILFNYIRSGNADVLCPLFDKENRSEQVRTILNGPENMRFIDKNINMAKGQIFGPNPGKLSSIIKRHKENHFATALDEYIYNIQPNFHATKSKLNQIFADFLKAYPEVHSQFNGTFMARSNKALATAHQRLEGIIAEFESKN
ncbi:hypothetical protein DSO57_1005461 [Entomophthora muscae]|uniref:Uncharacterized protein n=1 Tax=Entomophthora muscae TaxID=34485 RepID=A0ACC2T7R3_9FUNG|nr:hypothetical protein DSO57_1005461 [Entomophthora muscae]